MVRSTRVEYGLFGRGKQMPFVERKGSYVRVRYLDHELLIPISSTDLPKETEEQIDTRKSWQNGSRNMA